MPTKIQDGFGPMDWLVEVVYLNWGGKERRKVIGVSADTPNEVAAVSAALHSLKVRGQYPPLFKSIEVGRRHEGKIVSRMHGIGIKELSPAMAAMLSAREINLVGMMPT